MTREMQNDLPSSALSTGRLRGDVQPRAGPCVQFQYGLVAHYEYHPGDVGTVPPFSDIDVSKLLL